MTKLLGATPSSGTTTLPATTIPNLPQTPAVQMAQLLFDSKLFEGAKSVAGVFTIVEYGKEVGIPPVVALQNICIVKGRLCMGGQAMLALARKHDVKAEVKEETDKGCTIIFTRDTQTYTATFNEEDAEQAGLLGKDNWLSYPKDMYKWRAVAKGCRFIAPDLLGGIYLPEEIENIPINTQEDKPLPAPKEEEIPEEKITDSQIRRLHTMMTQTGLIYFKDIVRDFLYDKGLVDETKSSKTLRRGDADAIMDNFPTFEKKFYANEKYEEKLKATFILLDKIKKCSVLSSMRNKVEDKESVPECNAEMEDTMLNDYFGLFLVAIHNSLHNNVVQDAEASGLSIEETIEKIEELGLKPEIKEVTTLNKGGEQSTPTLF